MEEGKGTEWDTGGKYRSAQSIIGLVWHFGFFEALKAFVLSCVATEKSLFCYKPPHLVRIMRCSLR
jgi:hypothetical protein